LVVLFALSHQKLNYLTRQDDELPSSHQRSSGCRGDSAECQIYGSGGQRGCDMGTRVTPAPLEVGDTLRDSLVPSEEVLCQAGNL
jgi:hypothetical protein